MVDNQIHRIELSRISPSPTNPRKHFDEEKLRELSESIRTQDVLQPILIRHKKDSEDFELIAGERRYRASLMAGLMDIPAFIREMSDLQVLEVQVVENMQRDDLHPLEEAEGYERLMKEHAYTADLLAEKVNKSKAYIYAKLKLTALCEEARAAFYSGLSESIALLIARIPTADLQKKALKGIIAPQYGDGSLSVRQSASYIQNNFMLRIDQAPFKTSDESLLPGVGACGKCPNLAANQPEIYSDLKNADVCTDPDCFAKKKQASIRNRKAEAEAKGQAVICGEEAKKLFPYGIYGSNKWKKLDEHDYSLPGKSKTYRQLLKKDMPPVTLIEDVRDGILVECVAVKDIHTALPELIRIASSRDSSKEEEKAAREETAFRRQWLDEIRREFAKELGERSLPLFPTLNGQELKMVAEKLFGCLDFDTRKRLLSFWFEEKISHDFVYQFERELIEKLPDQDICALLIDCCLIGETHVALYSKPDTGRMQVFSEKLGINHEAIKKEMVAVRKAKEAAKAAKKTNSSHQPEKVAA